MYPRACVLCESLRQLCRRQENERERETLLHEHSVRTLSSRSAMRSSLPGIVVAVVQVVVVTRSLARSCSCVCADRSLSEGRFGLAIVMEMREMKLDFITMDCLSKTKDTGFKLLFGFVPSYRTVTFSQSTMHCHRSYKYGNKLRIAPKCRLDADDDGLSSLCVSARYPSQQQRRCCTRCRASDLCDRCRGFVAQRAQ